MLFWNNPSPIYDATYIFKVYPRKKTDSVNYYTTFFWGNNGTFRWDGGQGNTYYGAHPYPVPPPSGAGQWEISVYRQDKVTGTEVKWGRWYTQAFRAWRESRSVTYHEFYYDLPDMSKVLRYTVSDHNWGNKNPPTPAIVMGQAPDLCGPPPGNCGQSWGGFPNWEEFNGVIRGIQIYSGLLSLSDIQSELNSPKSTKAGQNLIWYLNLDPRPSDVTDNKGIGSPHNPSWDGTTALEWSSQASVPSAPPASADGGGSCFIATAAFGSSLAIEVSIIREFRDNYLMTNFLGQALISIYTAISPPIAHFIAEHDSIRAIVRVTLYPIVGLCYLVISTPDWIPFLFFNLLLVGVCTAWGVSYPARFRGQPGHKGEEPVKKAKPFG